MKKKLLCAVGVLLLVVVPIALLALPIRVGGTPTVLEVCVGGTEPTGGTLISFAKSHLKHRDYYQLAIAGNHRARFRFHQTGQ